MRMVRSMTLSALMLAAVAVVGCSHEKHTTSLQNRQEAVSSLHTMRSDLAKIDGQVQLTQASLHDLVNQQGGDLTPTYKAFDANVDKAVDLQGDLSARQNAVTASSYRYINDWSYNSRDIRDNQLRDDSISRHQQARQQYEQSLGQMNDVQAAYANYVHTIQDVRAYAAANLSQDGLPQIRSYSSKADDAAQNLRQRLSNLDGNLNQLASSWDTKLPYQEGQKIDVQNAQPAGGRMEAVRDPNYRDQRGMQNQDLPANQQPTHYNTTNPTR